MIPELAPGQLLPARIAVNVTLVVGLGIAAGIAATLTTIAYRLYARARIPEGLAVLAGLAVVAVTLNTDAALGQVIGGGVGLLDVEVAVRNVVVFLVAAAVSVGCRRAGDRFALGLGAVSGARQLDGEVSRLVKSVGRRITVTLPGSAEEIEDIEGYDPVPPETKAAIAGKTFVFPKGLTVETLRERLVERLRDDHGVGHADVDLAPDGTVEYLALGSRAAGIGPSLVPGTAAVAIRADPPYSAASGDVVQVWTAGGEPELVATAEFRAAVDDVVTVATDEVDAEAIDPARRYRLVIMPSGPRVDREFATLLRRAHETMGLVTVGAASPLTGTTVGGLDLTVVAVRRAGGGVETIPPRSRPLAPGDELYAIARPEALRRLERAAAAPPEAEPS